METPVEVKRTRPKIYISSVTTEDIPALVRVFLLAFGADEHMPAFSPHRVGLTTCELLEKDGPLEERRFLRELVGKEIHVKAVARVRDNEGMEKETLVGWARWAAPPGVRRRTIWEWLWSEILYPLQLFLFRPTLLPAFPAAAMALITAQNMDTFGPGGAAEGRKYWHLHFLCVDPAWQGCGIGGALLSWGTERAKETHSVVYLESSPAARAFYISKGFRVASERFGEVNGMKISLPGMIWEPGMGSRNGREKG